MTTLFIFSLNIILVSVLIADHKCSTNWEDTNWSNRKTLESLAELGKAVERKSSKKRTIFRKSCETKKPEKAVEARACRLVFPQLFRVLSNFHESFY